MPDDQLVDDCFKGVAEKDKPLVLLFGWAGATEKNIAKYSDIYIKAGCVTLAYNLPTRFIFQISEDTPYLSKRLVHVVEDAGLERRPMFLHIMSDTGETV